MEKFTWLFMVNACLLFCFFFFFPRKFSTPFNLIMKCVTRSFHVDLWSSTIIQSQVISLIFQFYLLKRSTTKVALKQSPWPTHSIPHFFTSCKRYCTPIEKELPCFSRKDWSLGIRTHFFKIISTLAVKRNPFKTCCLNEFNSFSHHFFSFFCFQRTLVLHSLH